MAPSQDAGGNAEATNVEELLSVDYYTGTFLPGHLYRPDRVKLQKLLTALDQEHGTTKEHGDVLEDLTREIFAACRLFEGLKVDRVTIGQIDFACRVRCLPGTLTQDWSSYLVGECKHQKDKVGFPEIAKLTAKMRGAKTKIGIAVATEGLTGDWDSYEDALGYVRQEFNSDSSRILCLTRIDLDAIVAGESLITVLQEKVDQLHFSPRSQRPN